jgi:hypothetical protein
VPEAGKQYCCKYCLQDDDPRYQPLSAIVTDVNAAKELCVQKMLPKEAESIGTTNNWPKKMEYAQAVIDIIQRVISEIPQTMTASSSKKHQLATFAMYKDFRGSGLAKFYLEASGKELRAMDQVRNAAGSGAMEGWILRFLHTNDVGERERAPIQPAAAKQTQKSTEGNTAKPKSGMNSVKEANSNVLTVLAQPTINTVKANGSLITRKPLQLSAPMANNNLNLFANQCLVVRTQDVLGTVHSRDDTQIINGSDEQCWTIIVRGACNTEKRVLVIAVTKLTWVWEVLDYMEDVGALPEGERAQVALLNGKYLLCTSKRLGQCRVGDGSILDVAWNFWNNTHVLQQIAKAKDTGHGSICTRLVNLSQLHLLESQNAEPWELHRAIEVGLVGFACSCEHASSAAAHYQQCEIFLPTRGVCPRCSTTTTENGVLICGCSCRHCKLPEGSQGYLCSCDYTANSSKCTNTVEAPGMLCSGCRSGHWNSCDCNCRNCTQPADAEDSSHSSNSPRLGDREGLCLPMPVQHWTRLARMQEQSGRV